MLSTTRRHASRSGQAGLSLVELMVGIAVGLIVVAGATLMVTSQLTDNRRLLVETQLQQDLRSAADIVARELRRAGYWRGAVTNVWSSTNNTITCNRFTTVVPATAQAASAAYRYERDAGSDGPLGFKVENHVLKSALTIASPPAGDVCAQTDEPSNWQEITDSRVLRITSLTVEAVNGPEKVLPCSQLCPSTGDASCWPTTYVRELKVKLTGEAAADSSVARTVELRVRLRNDQVAFNDPAAPTRMCPL